MQISYKSFWAAVWSLSCLLQVVWWDQSGWSPPATSWPQTTTRRLCTSWASKTCRWEYLGYNILSLEFISCHHRLKWTAQMNHGVCLSDPRWCLCLWELRGGRGRGRASSCRPPVCLLLRRSTSPCCCSSRSHTSLRCSTCWRCWPASNRPAPTPRRSTTTLRWVWTPEVLTDAEQLVIKDGIKWLYVCVLAECTLWGASPPRRESVSAGLGAADAASNVSQDAAGLPEHLRWHGQSTHSTHNCNDFLAEYQNDKFWCRSLRIKKRKYMFLEFCTSIRDPFLNFILVEIEFDVFFCHPCLRV